MREYIHRLNTLFLQQIARIPAFFQAILKQPISIKLVTIVGFVAAILPLVVALLYGSKQINTLAEDSENNVVDVVWITNKNRLLNQSVHQLQRTSSQFLILREVELLSRIDMQYSALLTLVKDIKSRQQQAQLHQSLSQLRDKLSLITQDLKTNQSLSLKQLQVQFASITPILEAITSLNDQRVKQHIERVERKARNTQSTLLFSLLIIPVSILVALAFVLVITAPLETLAKQIKRLEQGKFDNSIHYSGAHEVRAIGHALEQMRIQLQQLELQKSSFIRHISHELKTPLAAIREGTELLYDNSVGDLNTAQQEITNIIRSNASRLQTLIEDLLDFNIVLDSTSLLNLQDISLTDTFNQCVAARKLDVAAKQIDVLCLTPDTVIKSNEKQLSVIFDNLLSNAIKYAPIASDIRFSIRRIEHGVEIAIADQGPGLSDLQKEKAFDAFFQGPPPEDYRIKSSGLGLTIVKELTRRLNGNVRLDDTSGSSGLTVVLTLPSHQE